MKIKTFVENLSRASWLNQVNWTSASPRQINYRFTAGQANWFITNAFIELNERPIEVHLMSQRTAQPEAVVHSKCYRLQPRIKNVIGIIINSSIDPRKGFHKTYKLVIVVWGSLRPKDISFTLPIIVRSSLANDCLFNAIAMRDVSMISPSHLMTLMP